MLNACVYAQKTNHWRFDFRILQEITLSHFEIYIYNFGKKLTVINKSLELLRDIVEIAPCTQLKQ